MAKLVMQEGESIKFKVRVGSVGDSYAACELIATDRRLVLTAIDTRPTAFSLFGALGGLFGGLLSRGAQVTHQIQRDKFGGVELTGKKDLRVESTGEGYARQWFEISTKQPQQLAELIQRWASGTFDPSPEVVIKTDA